MLAFDRKQTSNLLVPASHSGLRSDGALLRFGARSRLDIPEGKPTPRYDRLVGKRDFNSWNEEVLDTVRDRGLPAGCHSEFIRESVVKKKEIIGRPQVAVIDDDESVRESLEDLLGELGYAAKTFSSGQEFLASGDVELSQCLIVDISMPGMSGPDLYQELMARGRKIPVIFITAHESAMRPRLLQQGAVECLAKPFSDTALLDALKAAIRE